MLRADALATLYLFHPLRKASACTSGVPILMYHSISDSAEETKHPYYQTVTTPAAFARQMQFLHRNGYSTVKVSEVARWARTPGRGHKQPVAITFDDGFRDFHRHAFPILSQYGFSATVYLPTAYIDEAAREFKGHECLTWSEVRELHKAGVEFGSHTVTHAQLDSLETEAVRYEVRSSKEIIEERLGYPVTSFAYPFAFPETKRAFTARLRELLEEAGYDNGVSTMIGTVDQTCDRLFMKRLPINSGDDIPLFRAKLEGSYDWLHAVQYASKLVTTSIRRAPWCKPRIA
jgi:peptidoglycan/xylan/chitin deacetylase (PgdA/CDA1 family)